MPPFIAAALLAAPIYLIHFGLHSPPLTLLLVVAALWLWLGFDPVKAFWGGFFTGLFWFWWIALSLRYYDLAWMIPLALLLVGAIYGAIFWAGYRAAQFAPPPFRPFARALFWLAVGSIHPFGFNWFVPQMLLLFGGIHPDALHFALLLLIAAALRLRRGWIALAFLPLLLYPRPQPASPAPIAIKLITTTIPQDRKWLPSLQPAIVAQNLAAIDAAIAEGHSMVVLPESAFPLFLNLHPDLLAKLKERSRLITILTGALYRDKKSYYNSAYLFEDGNLTIMHKKILVPFGEYIPLPQPLRGWINETFFGGSSDYTPAKEPATFTIKGISFASAICYEATHPAIYATDAPYIIAISNNAWFTPSIEPTLQWMLIKYYATIHKKTVYHATNIAKTAVIR